MRRFEESSVLVTRGPAPAWIAASAATAVTVLVTRVDAFNGGVAPEYRLHEFFLTGALFAVTALGHTALLALVARFRSTVVGVAALVWGAMALPRVSDALRPYTGRAMAAALPRYCADLPELCPPPAWDVAQSVVAALCLAPFLVALMEVRARDALDGRARVAWASGLMMIVAAGVIPWFGRPSPVAGPVTCVVGLALMALATAENARRLAWVAARLGDGGAWIAERTPGAHDGLRPLCAPATLDLQDGVLVVRDRAPDAMYRAALHGTPVATLSIDGESTLDAMRGRLRRQRRALAVAAVGAAAVGVAAVALRGG